MPRMNQVMITMVNCIEKSSRKKIVGLMAVRDLTGKVATLKLPKKI